ncbi:type IV toxin-antitoxin system AbiEi family antitoxin domain-containing protein [Corynebacterium sp. AOP12-C2-36]|uniref:type IV toxin-antitoxin system AbiEi family antitoxin domain-containing protein n=2 Tax=Corynebacterium TaxID=1716 RepID=UPI004033A791
MWSTAQLSARGLTRHGIATKVANGELIRLARGYYAAGDVSEMQVLQALAAGHDGLVFRGTTAGAIYGGGCEKMSWPAQAYLPRGGARSGGALLDVRTRARPRTRRVEGLDVITPVQTAVELMQDVPAQHLGEMLARAYPGVKGNDVLASDIAALSRSRRGAVAGLLDGVVTGTASNREARVLVEIDSFAFHGAGGAKAGERTFVVDRWKGNMATRWGWALLRYTDRCIGGALAHVVDEPEQRIMPDVV